MSNAVKPKAAAAKRGCLSARQWQDIRQAGRLARSEGITLIMHGVTVAPSARGHPEPEFKSTVTSARGGRGQQPKEAIGGACEQPPAKQHEQRPPKQQREQDRSLQRLNDFQQAIACGVRWQPLVQKLLRKVRAISRHNVWTAHMSHNIELRNKMGDFLARVLRHLRSRELTAADSPLVDRDRSKDRSDRPPAPPVTGALGVYAIRTLLCNYLRRCDFKAALKVMKPIYLGNFLWHYVQEYNVQAAYTIAPPGRRSSRNRPIPSDTPPDEQRGAARASKKPKGSRSHGGRR